MHTHGLACLLVQTRTVPEETFQRHVRSERSHHPLLHGTLTSPYCRTLQAGEDSGALTAWTGILDNRLVTKLETVEEIHAVGEMLS